MKREEAHTHPGTAENKKLVILGAGESGTGAAVLGKKKGYNVFVSDKGTIKQNYKDVLNNFEIDWEEGAHTMPRIHNADLVVKSPGIPDTIPLLAELRKKGIPVISEIEFAARYTRATLVGITGSNGKTTTTMLTYHLLKHGGLNVEMAGNVGKSFAKAVTEAESACYVLELSSFQLDGIVEFHPHIAVITNIVPDHLDRYDHDFEKYVASKFRIVMNQTEEDYLIYNADDEVVTGWLQRRPVKPKLIPFSTKTTPENGTYIKNDNIMITTHNEQITLPVQSVALEGAHNLKNAMAASTVSRLLSVRKKTIRESLQHFQGVEHRLEKVLKIQNVTYINDSKATNVNAAYYALDSVKAPVVWIVGGQDKGNDYAPLMALVREKVKAIICLGINNAKIIDAFGSVLDLIMETVSMDEAVKIACKIAERGDTVLLAPACASFDLFKNYEDRGKKFKEAVRKL